MEAGVVEPTERMLTLEVAVVEVAVNVGKVRVVPSKVSELEWSKAEAPPSVYGIALAVKPDGVSVRAM